MNNTNNCNNDNNNQQLDGLTIFILILAAFGLIVLIFDISDAMREVKRKRADRELWYYENIKKGADEFERNHPNGTLNYNSIKTNSGSSSNTGSVKKTSSTSTTSSSYKTKTSYNKTVTTEARSVEPDDHDIDAYYEDYKDEFENEDDAWDDFEDNEDSWDDY